MASFTKFGAVLVLMVAAQMPVAAEPASECVILLHGLARSADSMRPMADALRVRSYRVVNVSYPSRSANIAKLAQIAIEPALSECRDAKQIHFVTHSLGGILVRHYLKHSKLGNLGRVVMLGPPNKGSEVVDVYSAWPGVAHFCGPAFVQLSAEYSHSVPLQLGAVEFELGVIAGKRSVNPLLSLLIPGPDDGKVSVESSKVAGMSTHVVFPVSHVFMMRDKRTINATYRFLRYGYF